MTRSIAIVAAALLSAWNIAAQATVLDQRVDTATQILQDLKRMPENAIPPALLNRAYAVAVIPSVIKAGFIVGGTYGKGIIVARRADGTWSNPSFVMLTQGSFGFQAGAQSTDLILVFKTRRALDGISSGKITLGGDASIAAGPVGRQATAATDIQMQSEIYSYARSRGFFAGVSLEGGVLSMDRKANGEYYQGEIEPREDPDGRDDPGAAIRPPLHGYAGGHLPAAGRPERHSRRDSRSRDGGRAACRRADLRHRGPRPGAGGRPVLIR